MDGIEVRDQTGDHDLCERMSIVSPRKMTNYGDENDFLLTELYIAQDSFKIQFTKGFSSNWG